MGRGARWEQGGAGGRYSKSQGQVTCAAGTRARRTGTGGQPWGSSRHRAMRASASCAGLTGLQAASREVMLITRSAPLCSAQGGDPGVGAQGGRRPCRLGPLQPGAQEGTHR